MTLQVLMLGPLDKTKITECDALGAAFSDSWVLCLSPKTDQQTENSKTKCRPYGVQAWGHRSCIFWKLELAFFTGFHKNRKHLAFSQQETKTKTNKLQALWLGSPSSDPPLKVTNFEWVKWKLPLNTNRRSQKVSFILNRI